MQYRDNKNFQKGQYYHIFNRGNNKQPTFLDKLDFYSFLKRVRVVLGLPTGSPSPTLKPLPPNSFSIHAYCLMNNHFHFLIKQNSDIPISKLLSKVCTSYSLYFNKRHGHVGHLFQDRFKAKLITNDVYFTYLTAYIHNNPPNPISYEFSSFGEILGLKPNNLCERAFLLSIFSNNPENYKKFVLNFSDTQKSQIEDITG